MAAASPTVRRRRLAAELRRLREGKKLNLEQAAVQIGISRSTLSRIETGRSGARPRELQKLLKLYEVSDQDAEALVALSRAARQLGWWYDFEDVLLDYFEDYIGLEDEAESMRIFQVELIPGLLQTRDYATAVVRAERPDEAPEAVERRVALRMSRQALLARSEPPKLWFIVSEAALRQMVGGEEVMRGQLEYLAEVHDRFPHVTLQVLPFSAGAHPAMGSAFLILEFPELADPDVVYMENLTGALYIEKRAQVSRYGLLFDHLRAAALSPDASTAFLCEMMEKQL
jgi:transcriptional regulator with XRE-family HTH domain